MPEQESHVVAVVQVEQLVIQLVQVPVLLNVPEGHVS